MTIKRRYISHVVGWSTYAVSDMPIIIYDVIE